MYHNRYLWLIILCTTTLFTQSAFAQLTAEVDRREISVHETLQLFVASSEQGVSLDLNVSGLEKNFYILRRSSSNNISIINGKMESIRRWQFQIKPKRSGNITIPSFVYDNNRSKPITIKVLPPQKVQAPIQAPSNQQTTPKTGTAPTTSAPKQASTTHSTTQAPASPQNSTLYSTQESPSNQEHKDVSLDVTVNKSSLYVQEELLLTVRVRYSVNLYEASLADLDIQDAILEAVGEKRNYQTQIGGQLVHIVEQRFVIYPLSPGTLTIPTVALTGIIPVKGPKGRQHGNTIDQILGHRFPTLSSTRRQIERHFPAFDIEVKPIPNAFPKDRTWLPARSLTLQQSWQPQSPTFSVGEPVTRILTLQVDGQHQTFLPDIPKPDVDDIKIYTDQADLTQQSSALGLLSTQTVSHAILPAAPGQFILPKTEIHWWNTELERLEVTTLEPESHHAEAGEGYTPQPEPQQHLATLSQSELTEGPAQPNAFDKVPAAMPSWALWAIALLALLLIASIGALLFVLRRRKETPRNHAPRTTNSTSTYSTSTPSHHPNQRNPIATKATATPPTSLSKATRKLIKTCKTEDNRAIKEALLQWGRLATERDDLLSLEALTTELNSEALTNAIATLNQNLYGNNSDGWDRDALIEAIKHYRPSKGGRDTDQMRESLDPSKPSLLKRLYPF